MRDEYTFVGFWGIVDLSAKRPNGDKRKRCVKCVLENESDYGRFGGLGVCGRVETRCFWDFLGLELSNCECEVTLTLTL